MSGNWSQGGHHLAPHQNRNNNYNAPPPNTARGRSPICFICGQEGHFVKDCPKQTGNGSIALPAPQIPHPVNSNGFGGTHQRKQWANAPIPNGPAAYNKYAPYTPSKPASVPQFPQPTHNPQYDGPPAPAPYVAPSPSYQQYPPQGPQQQQYHQAPQQGYSNYQQNQQYGPSAPNAPQYNQSQPQSQQYNPPQPQRKPQQQYGSQIYAPPYGRYAPSNPQQYPPPAYPNHSQQQHNPPAPAFQPPPTPQSNGYNQGYQNRTPSAPYQGPPKPQWNGSPQTAGPFQPPPYQQQAIQAPNPGFKREFTRSQSQQSQQSQQRVGPQQSQGRASTTHGLDPSKSTPSRASQSSLTSQAPQTSQSTTTNGNRPQTTSVSTTSSAASTPYASPTSKKSKVSEWDGQPPTPRKNSDRTEKEKSFNWDFKNIFYEEKGHETVALAHPLANTFDLTPVPLIDKNTKNPVSRYVRKDNRNEYMQSVRDTPQWPYLQEDPAFYDSSLVGPTIPLKHVRKWMEARHGNAYARLETRKSSSAISRRKRNRSEENEQADIDQQLQSDMSSSQHKRQKVEGPSRIVHDGLPRTPSARNGNKTPPPATSDTVIDDIWAPQPGEGADPTEALLKSLGVTGVPKPVEPGPPVIIPAEHFQPQKPIYNPQSGNQPFRQNGGYNNVPGSHNYGPPQPMFNGYIPPPPPPVEHDLIDDPWPVQNVSITPPPPDLTSPEDREMTNGHGNGKTDDEKDSRDDSPLSPTSMEILGKLTKSPVKPPRKIVRVISGKNKKVEAARQLDDTTARFKRSQPVVDEAYSRRW